MTKTLGIALVVGLSFAAVLPAQDEAGVREAVRFERAKDAADARQAGLERQAPKSNDSVAAKTGRPVVEHGVPDAVAMERAKDAADARQARIEGRSNAQSSADRTAPKR